MKKYINHIGALELTNEATILKQFQSLNNVFYKTKEEIDNFDLKAKQIVVYKVNDIEMVTYDVDDFLASINDEDYNNLTFLE